jgi:Tol biopolymer transport system component
MRRVAYVGLIAVLGSVLGAPPASATFPGSNGKIAYGAYKRGPDQIGVIEADGSGRTLLTSTPNASNTDPAWSADGSKIAFGSKGLRENDLPKLRTMNADGTGRTRIVTLSRKFFYVNHPSWSPDGGKIAFCGYSAFGGDSKVFTVNTDGTGLDRLTPNGDSDCDPDWSPDGTTIAFSAPGMIATMDADGSNRQFLGVGFAPSWSPDGGQLVFVRLVTADQVPDVFVMNADGTGVTAVTETPNRWETSPTFSPDGTKIAFIRTAGIQYYNPHDIWLVTVPGGVFTRLTDTPKRDEIGLSWQAI